MEMVGTMVTQLTRGATAEDMRRAGLDPYYADDGGIIGLSPMGLANIFLCILRHRHCCSIRK